MEQPYWATLREPENCHSRPHAYNCAATSAPVRWNHFSTSHGSICQPGTLYLVSIPISWRRDHNGNHTAKASHAPRALVGIMKHAKSTQTTTAGAVGLEQQAPSEALRPCNNIAD